MMKEFTAWGGKVTVVYDGEVISNPSDKMVFDKIDCDLRADAVADASKTATVPFIIRPCDEQLGCHYGTITAPPSVWIHLVQEVLQQQLAATSSKPETIAVPQTGIWDCKTAAYMVVAHQLIAKTGVGDVAGWPLDAFDMRETLAYSERLFAWISDVVESTKNQYASFGDFQGFDLALPDDAKGLKFYRAEVPASCTAQASSSNWGLIAAVGIAVAGVLGATYAISQRRKTAAKGRA